MTETPKEVTDTTGQIVWQADYKAWGEIDLYRVHQIDQPLRFQGQYADDETGLYYTTFRYYDPRAGRFTTQDPIGLAGGWNLYQYAPNPTGWVDPLGLSCASISAEELAQKKAQELLASATSKTQMRKLPRAISAVLDRYTGKAYYGYSGRRTLPEIIHPLLEKRMPKPSLEEWVANNCAEFKAVNKALLDGALLKNLEVHTIKLPDMVAYPMCKNCNVTIHGTIVTSE